MESSVTIIAGKCDRPADRTAIVEYADFNHPEVLDISRRAFDAEVRTSQLTDDIMAVAKVIRDELELAIERFGIRAIIAENALTIPMNLSLGIAIVQAVQETKIGCVAHHHEMVPFRLPPVNAQPAIHFRVRRLSLQRIANLLRLSCVWRHVRKSRLHP